MKKYFHSVTLDKEKCKGCTNCIKRCPTEAIRVRDGKAKIIKERCIDCGECIRVCPYHAKKAITDAFDDIFEYQYKIALPAPTLYGQFKNIWDVNVILTALKHIGFDDVFEVAKAAEFVSDKTNTLFKQGKVKNPAISAACPAIVRLIRVRFPGLIDNIIPLEAPMEVAARFAKKEAAKQQGLLEEQVGVFFITPCAAKVTSTKVSLDTEQSYVDGVISMKDIYLKLMGVIGKIDQVESLACAGMYGVGWANSGGESAALRDEQNISVDGIHNVIKVLEELEDEKLTDIDFVELLACTGGCVGGPLTLENNFVAQNRVQRIAKMMDCKRCGRWFKHTKDVEVRLTKPVTYEPVMKLDHDMVKAMKKMEQLESIYEHLPGLDCGSCGAPSCYSLAEDIVRGFATETDCIFMLREKVRNLTKEMMELESKMPPAFRKEEE